MENETNVRRKDLTQACEVGDITVKVKVPHNASQGSVPGTDIAFWQWPVAVRGGIVNVYIHTKDDPRGRNFVCRLEVWNRQLEDGRRWFNHVDLHPCEEAITHRFAVAVDGQHTWPDDALVFSAGCFNLAARIVILGKDEKLIEISKGAEVEERKPSTAKPRKVRRQSSPGVTDSRYSAFAGLKKMLEG